MAKRETIRDLSRKVPATPEIEKIMDGLRVKDDMHVAIMAVSIVEATLERLITSRLKKRGKDFLFRIFDNRGPMSDFSSKIIVAEGFGIITGPLAKELHSMRVIRNAFAHTKFPISFEDEPVKAEVKKLKMVEHLRSMPVKFPASLKDREWFLLATRMSLVMMDVISKSDKSADEVFADALSD